MLWLTCLCECCSPFNVNVYSFFYSVFLFSMLEYDTENMNSDEIFSSLRGVTEAIQSFSYRSQEDLNEPIRRDGKKDDAVSLCFNSGQQEQGHRWGFLISIFCTFLLLLLLLLMLLIIINNKKAKLKLWSLNIIIKINNMNNNNWEKKRKNNELSI